MKDPNIELGKCYSIAGRRPIIVTQYSVVYGKRVRGHTYSGGFMDEEPGYVYVKGYTPRRYRDLAKFNTIVKQVYPIKTLADVERTEWPTRTEFRFRPSSKIVELE